MVKLYSDADLYEAVIQKRKLLAVFLSVTAVWFCAVLAFTVWYSQLPYQDPLGVWLLVICCVLTAAYIIFAFPFMGICYKRSRNYCKLLRDISFGAKEYARLPYLDFDNWTVYAGVDFNVALFGTTSIKRDEALIRQIYIDGEKEFPPFRTGQTVQFVSHGNVLIEYEIIADEEETDGTEEARPDATKSNNLE